MNRLSEMRTLFLLISLTVACNAMAQLKQFTLEDLNYGGNNYYNMSPKNQYYTWWGDELVRTDVEKCFVVDKKTGKEKVMFSLDEVNSWIDANDSVYVRHLYNATFPYSGKTLVMLGNRYETILVDWKAKKQVWSSGEIGSEAAEWCPQSKATAYVKDWQLYVGDADGVQHKITSDGSSDIVYGKSVHRDEFGIYKGTFWSPDGQKLAFYRMDQSMVTDYPLVNTSTRIATLEADKYPMAGEAMHKVTVGVYDMKTDKTIYLKAGDPTDRYFTNVSWSPDSRTIYIQELNRDQNDMQLVSYDAVSGNRLKVLYTEQHDKYVEPQHPITFLPWDSSKFILQSQKDGYNHLYIFDKDGNQLKQLTQGKWVVLDILGFNAAKKQVIIRSTECNPLQNNLFAVDVKTGKRTLLDNGRGCHANVWQADGGCSSALSASGTFIYDSYTEPDVPRNIDVIDIAKVSRRQLFSAENPWKGYDVPGYSCGTIKAADGSTDLYYRMVKPTNFDPQKKYPTVIYVYGGPHARNVEARWNWYSRGWETYMAQKGYLLFILDNRGSKDRGRDFEQATFRHLGQEEMKDQVKGAEFLKSLPYVDADRIGVHGWSFGGFMTISLMVNYPDIFKVGVAGGPVIDWSLYEVMYGERYMDTPQDNPEGYEQTNLIRKAKDLKGKLQIIQGMNDPTVVPQHCLQFIHECNIVGTQPDFYVYPGEPHNMRGHQSTHLHERITQYFEDYLK
ncbi:MAG: DPP IV N-terminal domain-containing protein [Prevotella sp.]|nr:DPP IV N-terminal domain-containing protein [Prevotella sp.]